MAINLRFDLTDNPEPPTIILANRNGNKLGQLKVNAESIELSDKFNDASELSFTINKYIDNELTPLWEKVVDFKLVYCKEWDCWFEIKVELDEETETVKTVFCTQLGQAELSQIMLYDIEINTEDDIARDDYKVTVLYNSDDPEASLLNRLLSDKAPHYSIAHVDSTIANIQRSFSFDDTSIYDAFQEIAEEIGCIFIFPSNSNEDGEIKRDIFVYDLWRGCVDCGYRNESETYFINDSDIYLTDESDDMLVDESGNYLLYKRTIECPKCGSENIVDGYGEDTLIFITSDELACDGIQLTTDTDSVKNCFKLEAGDDLMTATVRSCNPNGTDYIWHISNSTKEDMSNELVEKLESYDELYNYYQNDYTLELDEELVNSYNTIVEKYSIYNEELKLINTVLQGYQSLMNVYYDVIDLSLYLESSLMPSIEISETNAEEQAKLLVASSLSPVAVANINTVSLATANSVILSMAKIFVKSTYKIQVNASELSDDGTIWKGNFVITNYSDEEDIAISDTILIDINDDTETFIKQKIEKMLNKEDTEDLSISGLFELDYDDFCNELKKYALNPLVSFRDACQACIDILIEQGIGSNETWANVSAEESSNNLYEDLYVPYYNKLMVIESEIKVREDEIEIISGVYDSDGNLITDGIKTEIDAYRNKIQEALDFKEYLGIDLWLEFCTYRREDKYLNENYISDGLNNADLFEKASEFIEVAKNEIYKSSELQHSISTTLKNLLAIPKFKPIVESFKVGNWIRVQIDNKIYKLRLLEYDISYNNFDNIPVKFSDVTKIKNGTTDIKNVLSQASSMATSYNSVQRQVSQGEKSNVVINSWIESGLNATNTKIIGTDDENQVWNKNGFLCREYDSITGDYSNEQLKIVNSTIAITDNNWETTKTAIGRYYYTDPVTGESKTAYGVNGETIVGNLLIGKQLRMANENGTLGFDENGLSVRNDVNTVTINPSANSIINIENDSGNIFSVNEEGRLVVVGDIVASNLTLMDGTSIETGNITGLSDVALSGSYNDLIDAPTKLSDFANDSSFVTKNVDDLNNYYQKTTVDDLLNSKSNINDLANVAFSGSYKSLIDIDDFKDWILEQIQSAINNS